MKLALLSLLSIFFLIKGSAALTSAAPGSKLELVYFNARGAAETARILLALAGADYTDTRFEISTESMESNDFKKAKESGELDMNLGRAPILIVDGSKKIGQSRSIERFIARKYNLYGSDEIEEAQVDCITEHCRDVKDAAMRKGFSSFNRQKSDEEKAVARREWFEEDMPAMFEKIEKCVALTSAKEGYAVGSSTSYADVAIFSLIMDCTMQADQEETLTAAKDCSLLMSIAERVANEKGVSKWVADRPLGWFDKMGMKKTKDEQQEGEPK